MLWRGGAKQTPSPCSKLCDAVVYESPVHFQFSPEVAKIVESIQKETGAQLTQEEEVISFLHNRERAVMKQLNDWKNELQQLKV